MMPAKKATQKEVKAKKPAVKKEKLPDKGNKAHVTVDDVMAEYREVKAEMEERSGVADECGAGSLDIVPSIEAELPSEDTVIVPPSEDASVRVPVDLGDVANDLLAEMEQERESNPQLHVMDYVQAVDRTEFGGLPVVAEIPEHAAMPDEPGLLARFPDGTVREPTKAELREMGREMARRLFGHSLPTTEPAFDPGAPPKPKISGNHCRLCKSFAGDDPRGSLWSENGLCLTYKHQQMPVSPEHYCDRFVFNEALRDNA